MCKPCLLTKRKGNPSRKVMAVKSRIRAKLQPENEIIANWLIHLTQNQVNWGFGLCFLYLCIRPRKPLKRDKPDALAVPEVINEC